MNILGQIGNISLLKLNRINEVPDVEIYVKCEFMNPGGPTNYAILIMLLRTATVPKRKFWNNWTAR